MEAGTRLGPYEVLDRLGAGGMGEVYRARDTRLGRTVAVKVLRDGADRELLTRLDREARAASSLNHPNIVHIYDVGEAAGGTRYVVMEHVDGETLRRFLNRERPTLSQAMEWGAQIAEGLAKAHQAGIVHRDLKPENLMVTGDAVVKILDFGLAKLTAPVLGDPDTRATLSRHGTQAGTLLGTLEYMAPEQATGRTVDHRADQFALGAILHEMVTGQSVFHRPSGAEVLAAILERQPDSLRRTCPEAPAELDDLVRRCLEKAPERRYGDTAEIARVLRGLGGRRPLASHPGRAVVVAEVIEPKPVAVRDDTPSVWSVQGSGDKVRVLEEGKLLDSIRRGKLTGMEMARREGDGQWQPLYETALYQREVPVGRDPLRAARLRSLRDVGGHVSGFLTTGLIMMAISGDFPTWMGIWGAVLVGHIAKAAPTIYAVVQGDLARRPSTPSASVPAVPAALPPSPLAAEAARVRALIEKRGGDDVPRLLADVDAIVGATTELGARITDLEEQTMASERHAVAAAVRDAEARLARADSDDDRAVFERQLAVVVRRRQGIETAERLLDRLRARRDTAEHELKQLRLDLSRGAASELPMPELSSRLKFIRHEAAAAEEIARG